MQPLNKTMAIYTLKANLGTCDYSIVQLHETEP